MGLACGSTFVFALLPAWRATRTEVGPVLKGESALASGRARWCSGRQALVVAQLAVSLVFLASTTLLVRGFLSGMGSDLGFDPKNLLTVMFQGSNHGIAQLDQLCERVRSLPGVRSVSVATRVPFALSGGGMTIKIQPPKSDTEPRDIACASVGPGYFDTLGVRLLRGRDFERQDNDSAPRVAILSEAAARCFWPGEDPLGKTIPAGFNGLKPRQIIGVVRDVNNVELRETPAPFIYLPIRQEPSGDTHLLVRTDGRLAGMAASVRGAMREVDKEVVIVYLASMEGTIHFALMPQWIGAWLGGLLGSLAFVLAVSGLYGAVAHAVSRRTREIGVRMALGARGADVLWMVLRQGLVLALAGVALGLPAALGIGYLMRSLLFGISPADPMALAGSSALVAAVALLASFMPARRAAGIKPMEALRHE
jgi:predicted permease